jgi:hypothetical protein
MRLRLPREDSKRMGVGSGTRSPTNVLRKRQESEARHKIVAAVANSASVVVSNGLRGTSRVHPKFSRFDMTETKLWICREHCDTRAGELQNDS